MSFDQIQNTPMSKEQIAEYLQRIEARRPDGTGLDLEYLTHLQAQHISHIPFENLDIMEGKPISLDRGDLFHKIISCRRGGVCSELNTLYNWLLESLGFDVTSYSARIIAATAPVQMRSHRSPYAKRHFSE